MRPRRRVQREKYSPVKMDNDQANVLRCLVADLLDIPTPPELVEQGVPNYPPNRLVEMGEHPVTPEMLAGAEVVDESGEPVPNALRDQATALRIIIALVAEGGRPTPEAVAERRFLELRAHGVQNAREEARELVEWVKAFRTMPPEVDDTLVPVTTSAPCSAVSVCLFKAPLGRPVTLSGFYPTKPHKSAKEQSDVTAATC